MMQVGEFNETVVRDVGSHLMPRVQNAPLSKSDIKEEQKKSVDESSKEKQNQTELNNLKESELNKAFDELNKHFKIFNTRLSFSFDEEKHLTVIKIQDRRSGEIIKQVPPEEMLESLSKISSIVGLLIDKLM